MKNKLLAVLLFCTSLNLYGASSLEMFLSIISNEIDIALRLLVESKLNHSSQYNKYNSWEDCLEKYKLGKIKKLLGTNPTEKLDNFSRTITYLGPVKIAACCLSKDKDIYADAKDHLIFRATCIGILMAITHLYQNHAKFKKMVDEKGLGNFFQKLDLQTLNAIVTIGELSSDFLSYLIPLIRHCFGLAI